MMMVSDDSKLVFVFLTTALKYLEIKSFDKSNEEEVKNGSTPAASRREKRHRRVAHRNYFYYRTFCKRFHLHAVVNVSCQLKLDNVKHEMNCIIYKSSILKKNPTKMLSKKSQM